MFYCLGSHAKLSVFYVYTPTRHAPFVQSSCTGPASNTHKHAYRAMFAFMVSSIPLGRALSNLPDMGRAQKAATAILSLLSRHSNIDASTTRGRKLVCM